MPARKELSVKQIEIMNRRNSIVSYMALGMTNQEIAFLIHVSISTIEQDIHAIKKEWQKDKGDIEDSWTLYCKKTNYRIKMLGGLIVMQTLPQKVKEKNEKGDEIEVIRQVKFEPTPLFKARILEEIQRIDDKVMELDIKRRLGPATTNVNTMVQVNPLMEVLKNAFAIDGTETETNTDGLQ
jgi:uncharacterized protein YqgV (UPF0045/DUF77 family)